MGTPTDINIEDSSVLLSYLRDTGKISANETPTFVRLDGGVSNRAMWVKREHHPDWVMKQALEKLRVQVDWYSAPERIHREATGLRCLNRIVPQHVPEFIFEDHQHHILAMTAIPQPHLNWKSELLAENPHSDHAVMFGELLAQIHNAVDDYPEIIEEFNDRSFFEELRLEPYYGYTAEQVPLAQEYLMSLIDDTRRRRQALVHGDYSPKNVLLHDDRLYILDYEVIHFGDPAFDIGFSMTHFLSKAHYRSDHRMDFLQMARLYWEAYSHNISEHFITQDMETYAVRHTLGCLLARVAGRSPLEYLDSEQRGRQQQVVIDLIRQNIQTIPDLINAFAERLTFYHDKN